MPTRGGPAEPTENPAGPVRPPVLRSGIAVIGRAARIRARSRSPGGDPGGAHLNLKNVMNVPRLRSFVRHCVPLVLSAGLLAPGFVGCSTSSGAGVSGYATVTIRNHTAEDVVRTTVEVFGADGYQGGMSGPGKLEFIKAASFMTAVSRDGVIAAGSGGRPVKHADLDIVALGDGSIRLRCQAYMVTGGPDPFFQEQKWLPLGHYQSLLNKVEKQLR